MPDITDFVDGIKEIISLIFPDSIAGWVMRIFAGIILLWGVLHIISEIINLLKTHFIPLFYKPEVIRRRDRRQLFADHIESEIRRLNGLEAWHDARFAELEAEVEAEGEWRISDLLFLRRRSRGGLRREKSLSKALEKSNERLILLEGDPGSGKSVALRHVARSMARQAMKSRKIDSVIPIYINLKELVRESGKDVDRALIYQFVLKTLNRVNDRDIEEFLDDEFNQGLKEKTWLFLFDSFDEIPEVLSSTESDVVIHKYTSAISDFLHGMNQCRGIVASRYFRGPGQVDWPRFRILPLSEARRLELIKRTKLEIEIEAEIIGKLEASGPGIRSMANNPMFLGLICEHVRSNKSFPTNAHTVFETYVDTRFERDEGRLWERFQLEPKIIRETAEKIAFCIGAKQVWD